MKRVRSCENKPDRKTIEKNRRIEMKALCFSLVSLIPDHHFNMPKELLPQLDQIDEAASYIKILSERVEELKRKKSEALMKSNIVTSNGGTRSEMPILQIKELGGSDVEVVLISGLRKNFMLHKIVSILEEEGTQVLTVSISTVGDKIFHTLHAKVKVSRVGVDTSRISERIHELTSQNLIAYFPTNI